MKFNHLTMLFLFAASIYANPAQYNILWDIDFSPFAGGEDLLYATRLIERGESYFFRKVQFEDPKCSQARAFRLSELLTIWLPLNYEAMLIQHEVFGHGYRIRSLGNNLAKVSSYHLGVPPPYGPGGGATSYETSFRLTSSEEMSIAIAGVEATAILANETKIKWLTTRMLDAKQSLLYIFSQQDLSEYIGSMKTLRKHHGHNLDGHDIHTYLLWLNRTYPEKHLTSSRLRSLAWINLLDPFTFYSAWAALHYISSSHDTKIPMIPINHIGYLLGARLGLTPFGPEVFWENYFAKDNRSYYAYIKAGRHAYNNYIGAGVFLPVLFEYKKWNTGLRCDVWRQPKLLLKQGSQSLDSVDPYAKSPPLYSSSARHKMITGAALSVLTFYHFDQTFGLNAEIGAKSAGFLPGNALWGEIILRFGFSTSF